MIDEDPDRTQELSDLLSLPRQALVEAVGGWWQPAHPAEDACEPRVWFAAGYPVEVLLGVGRGGGAAVGMPAIVWDGHEPVLHVRDVREAPPALLGDRLLGWLRTEAADVTRRRRGAMFSCRYCRTRTGPEHRFEGQVCMACSSRYLASVWSIEASRWVYPA